jgi:hypothetical protein
MINIPINKLCRKLKFINSQDPSDLISDFGWTIATSGRILLFTSNYGTVVVLIGPTVMPFLAIEYGGSGTSPLGNSYLASYFGISKENLFKRDFRYTKISINTLLDRLSQSL